MWRLAEPEDDDSLVEMCLRLYDEDLGILPIHPENMRATLRALRREPYRGRAVVLEIESQLSGYALLIAFWSNELGGSICEVDELFVMPEMPKPRARKVAVRGYFARRPVALSDRRYRARGYAGQCPRPTIL